MIAIDAVQRTIILVKRFGLYVFVPLFLLIAYSYTSSTWQQYRATAKIELKDISPAEATTDIHSKSLVKQALHALPFQASYYDSQSPREELYGSEVPVKMRFGAQGKAAETWLNLDVTSANSYTITNQDTTAFYNFNEPVHASFGDFTVVRRGHLAAPASYIVRIADLANQVDEYYNNLSVSTADDGRALSLSILSGNPRKGAAFLNKLLQLYGGKVADRHGDLVTSKFTLIEKPEENFESASLSPLWFYFLALVAGLAIPLGVPQLKKQRKRTMPGWPIDLPKLLNQVQHRFAIKQVD